MENIKKILISILAVLVVLTGAVVIKNTGGNDFTGGSLAIRQTMPEIAVFTATSTVGSTAKYDVREYRHLEFFVSTTNSANCTLKIKASNQENVDFTSAATTTNRWAYIEVVDLEDGASVAGDTGIVLTGTDIYSRYEINNNYATYIGFEISAISAGSVNVHLSGSSN
jgi:hypothetical protein